MTGISAGAIVGALYCAGNSADDILSYFKIDSLLELVKFERFDSGLVDTDHFQKIIKENCGSDKMEDLEIKLTIGATNLNKGTFEIFEVGMLSKIAGASSAVPLLMKPVKIGDYQYVDGRVINNLLVEPLKETCDFIIGINGYHFQEVNDLSGVKVIAYRCFEIIAGNSVTSNGEKCDFFLEIKESSEYALFDFKHPKEIFNIGYKEMKAEMDKIKNRIWNL
ncbi:MAG: NTE family protein [Flavobacteriaceae bacterium]|jgi:NTE family protein